MFACVAVAELLAVTSVHEVKPHTIAFRLGDLASYRAPSPRPLRCWQL